MRLTKLILIITFAATQSLTIAQNSDGEYKFFNDGSNENTTSRENFLEICNKTNSMANLIATLSTRVMDRTALNLISEVGMSVVSLEELFVSTKRNCIINFKVKGIYKGTTVNSDIFCPVTTIKDSGNGKFSASMVDPFSCFKN